MGKVKSALEIAMEKAGKIGELSQEEKETIREEERIMSVMREFYQGKIDSNGLWQKLKGSKPYLLRKVQKNIIDTLSLGISDEEFQLRGKGILAIETLKTKPMTAMIESGLHAIKDLQKEYEDMKKQVVADLKRQMEMHPQLRTVPVRTQNGQVMQMTLSVDEAVKAKLADYLSEQEEQYNGEFLRIMTELKEEVR